jgi:hypothetical protein
MISATGYQDNLEIDKENYKVENNMNKILSIIKMKNINKINQRLILHKIKKI